MNKHITKFKLEEEQQKMGHFEDHDFSNMQMYYTVEGQTVRLNTSPTTPGVIATLEVFTDNEWEDLPF